jgi:hypothetical protein
VPLTRLVAVFDPSAALRMIARVCASERQNFRVSLIDFLSQQFPSEDTGTHLATANRAIELAQRDIVTAFARRRAAAK